MFQVGNHGEQFVDIYVNHVVVHTQVQVVLTRCAVHSRELQFGSLAYKTYLVQNQYAVIDIDATLQVLGVLVEHIYIAHVRLECQIDIGGHKERLYTIRLRLLIFYSRFVACAAFRLCFLAALVVAEPSHQLVEVTVVGYKFQFALQDCVVAEPFANVMHVTFQIEV